MQKANENNNCCLFIGNFVTLLIAILKSTLIIRIMTLVISKNFISSLFYYVIFDNGTIQSIRAKTIKIIKFYLAVLFDDSFYI